MRCDDLTRELASPTGDLSPAEIAGHLAACKSCAEWSRRADHLDRIWEATRPPEPTDAALDALWAGVSNALDAGETPVAIPFEGATHRRRAWRKTALIVAQAAAILAAAGLFLLPRGQVVLVKNQPIPPQVNGVQPPKVQSPREIVKVTKDPSSTIGVAAMLVSLVVREGQTAIVRIPMDLDKKDHSQVVIDVDQEEALVAASSSIPEGSQRDLFNAIEGMTSNAFGNVASR